MNSIRSITKDWKNKLAYSVFGSAFTILGVIAAFTIGDVTARIPDIPSVSRFNEITCSRLAVVDKSGAELVVLGQIIHKDNTTGWVGAFSKIHHGGAELSTDSFGGKLYISDRATGGTRVKIGIDKAGGQVDVYDKDHQYVKGIQH